MSTRKIGKDSSQLITFAYNKAKQESTGFTPFFLAQGREAEIPLDLLFSYSFPEEDYFIQTLGSRTKEARKLARIHSKRSQESNKDRYDTHYRTSLEISYGSLSLYVKMKPYLNPKVHEEHLEKGLEDDTPSLQEEDIHTERRQQPQTREEISSPITRSRAFRLRMLSQSKIYTILDVKNAYWHIPIDEKDRHKTSFVTQLGCYEWNRLPYEHIKHLEDILGIFEQEDIKLNLNKCNFLQKEIQFLGYTINSGKYTPNNTNIEAILKLNRPYNVKTLQRFLGTINIYNKFIPHYAQIRSPLNEPLLKNAPWLGSAKHEQAFQTLKNALISQPVLYIYDPLKPCHLFTDASSLGVAGVLKQPDEQGILHPIEIETLAIINSVQRFHTYLHNIHFTLHTDHLPLKWIKNIPLTKYIPKIAESYNETVHTTTGFTPKFLYYGIKPQYIEHDTETHTPIEKARKLAIERTIKSHEHSKNFMILNTQNPFLKKKISPWSFPVILVKKRDSKYRFCVDYRKLNNVTVKDVYPIPRIDEVIDTLQGCTYFSAIDLRSGFGKLKSKKETKKKQLSLQRMDYMNSTLNDKKCRFAFEELEILGYKTSKDGIKPAEHNIKAVRNFPQRQEEAFQTLKTALLSPPILGHFNPNAPTYIHTDASNIGISATLVQDIDSEEKMISYLSRTLGKEKWIIVLTVYYTRYAETKAVLESTVKEVSKFLVEDIFLRHGAPQYLISNRGSQFTSNLMKEVMKMCKIKHCFTHTTSYHPQTNGLTERLNRTLINMLSMYVNTDQKNWDEILPFITHAYNTTIQETTGYSSFFLMYGREPTSLLDDRNISVDIDKDDYDEYIKHHLDKVDRTRKFVINNTIKTQERMKKNYDKKHMERSYEPGELVAVWTPIRKIGKCENLLRIFFYPYRILSQALPIYFFIAAVVVEAEWKAWECPYTKNEDTVALRKFREQMRLSLERKIGR
ncbi:hypothetical protein LAZ67_14001978 [Cordylochernes scorpioides]|uniref:Integrase catalytic domain-containing protein n=1 Tax=Cordylochernes scorpioides TaxID=51811 RepID=A0ABY6L6I6_9ARAC|nr:hypothetical protein LAZ67_14001978 [Cordylochernes scorpioides]